MGMTMTNNAWSSSCGTFCDFRIDIAHALRFDLKASWKDPTTYPETAAAKDLRPLLMARDFMDQISTAALPGVVRQLRVLRDGGQLARWNKFPFTHGHVNGVGWLDHLVTTLDYLVSQGQGVSWC